MKVRATSPAVHVGLRRAAAAVLVATLVPLVALLEIDLQRRVGAAQTMLPPEAYRLPPASTIRALSFGYNEVAADFLWIRTISYFADHLTKDRDLRHLKRHVDNVLALDDRFKAVYRYGSTMLMSIGERRTTADVAHAIDLLIRAHERFPDEWRFPFNIGIYYLSDMRTTSTKLRAEWKRRGADWIARAALIGADIPWLPVIAAKVYAEQGDTDVAIRRLQETYLVTQDERMRQQIAFQLKRLHATKAADELRATDDEFQRQLRESGISFVPSDLFGLLALPAQPPFSLEGLLGKSRALTRDRRQ